MIAASEPQEFIPRGRRQVERHPGDVVLPSSKPQLNHESFLVHRLSQVALSEDTQKSESWKIRSAKNGDVTCEEELYARGKTAVWSRGAASHSGEKVVLRCYTAEKPLTHVLWCTFHNVQLSHKEQANNKGPSGTTLPCVCLVDLGDIQVFTGSGEHYIAPLQFQVGSVWPFKYGILLERAAQSSAPSPSLHETESAPLPTVFSLLHPLDEIVPVMSKHGDLSHMSDPHMKLVFTCEDPSICMMYDSRSGLHSVWEIRKATREECQVLCASHSTSSVFPHSGGASSSVVSNASGSGRLSQGRVPLFLGESSKASPGTSVHYVSPIQSSSPIHSPRSSKLHFTPMAPRASSTAAKPWLLSSSSCGTPPPESRLMTSQMPDSMVESRPLVPEICLEHIWTENMGVTKELGRGGPATRVFLSTDLVGQLYLCYLIPASHHLYVARVERSNEEQRLIFGVVNSIPAKDTVSLPELHMIAVLEYSGGVVLYSGLSLVGKVHVAGIPSALATSSYLAYFSSPFPKRSSMMASSRPPSAMEPAPFDDELHLLSPVAPPARLLMEEETDMEGLAVSVQRQGQLSGLRDAVENRFTLVLSDGSLFRISLPELCSSPLVLASVNVLKHVLPRDLAMQLLVRWYAARNAPGSQDICPALEWQLFIGIVLELAGYDVEKLGVAAMQDSGDGSGNRAKKKRASEDGSEEDWEYVLNSSHHRAVAQGLSFQLGLKHVPAVPAQPGDLPAGKINCGPPLFTLLPLVLFSLHLLYEELKLNLLTAESLPLLAQLLHQIARDLRLPRYEHHYWRDFPVECSPAGKEASQISEEDVKKLNFPSFLGPEPPDVFNHLYLLLRGLQPPPFPHISMVNPDTRNVVQLTALVVHGAANPKLQLEGFVKIVVPPGSRVSPVASRDTAPSAEYPYPQRVVMLLVELGYNEFAYGINGDRACWPESTSTSKSPSSSSSESERIVRQDLQTLPAAIALLLSGAIYQCRNNPPSDWPEMAYRLVMRHDLAALCKTLPARAPNGPKSTVNLPNTSFLPISTTGTGDGRKGPAPSRIHENDEEDGMETSETEVLRLRFNKDHRVTEVRRLLQSSRPVRIAITQRPEVSDHEFIEEQERHLYAICTRTMALPVGRGMFTLRSSSPVVTEPLPVPRLCLTGRAPPRGTTVDLSHIEVVPNMNLWPLFHNGVAAGLRIQTTADDIESTWIVFNKPKGTSDLSTEHAGFLMALGLNGHLSNLARWNAYEYLVKCHEMTSVGLLLGIAATKRGTMDVSTTKMLSLHLEALLPPTSIELDIQQNIQVAALLGVGLLYQGTAQRRMAEVLLSEIGSQKEKYKSPSYQIREGDSVNIDVTSPGATLALGMMFFNTGNRAVADWMKAPDTQHLLDFVRPDFLLLRMVSRALILWEEILPTTAWVESNIPAAIRPYCLVKPRPGAAPDTIDYETMNQAYCNILAGACMALGLRFAGSSNNEAFETLFGYAKMFTSLSGKSIAELAGKSTIETCLNVILLSLAMVMAGSGNLEVLRLCRHLRTRVGPTNSVVTYGSHLATHMALGLLFLGGGRYTLATSPAAVAAMICAFFPKFPTHSNDNRYHLQAFRHLYVLAVEPRLLLPRDIDTGALCYAYIQVVYLNTAHYEQQKLRMKAPCILPELSTLKQVLVEDDRYWRIDFNRDKNWSQLEKLLQQSGHVDVKQRAGCLSHREDPKGFRSLLAQTLTTDSAAPWSVKAESILAFSSEPSLVNFAVYFLECDSNVLSPAEQETMQILTTLTYECMTQDKLAILPIWISLLKALRSLRSMPSVFLTWQLKLVVAQIPVITASGDKLPLVTPEHALSVHHQVLRLLESWEPDLLAVMNQVLKGELASLSPVLLCRLASYLTYHDIPSPQRLASVVTGSARNPLGLLSALADVQPSAAMVRKLYFLLKSSGVWNALS
ncbi:anaphase-promoting complex subunit 1 isoform X2 [Anabrus simplex]|uniref:anaphase-promoting complex subunit 1 isoform X2 n=1 Tax=Anabrus simplex TaxID=316456 RepID=UPI0035A2C233